MSVHREFSYESPGERIFKIAPHLPKLLSNIKGYTFFGTQCVFTFFDDFSVLPFSELNLVGLARDVVD